MLPVQYNTLRHEMVQIISSHKNIDPTRLVTRNFDQLGFETIDIVDIILEVEKAYHITIPDEVPLHKVEDFVHFIASQSIPVSA